jgi:hypothetical protein
VLTRRHVVAIVSGTTLLALSMGGVAWAGAGGSAPIPRAHDSEAADVTTTSADETSTTVGDTSTTQPEDTSTTTVEVGETTTVPEETSTTTAAPTTTIPSSPTTVGQSCKPGWGYGDTNHCHSGPPGLAQANATANAKSKSSPKAKRNPHAG